MSHQMPKSLRANGHVREKYIIGMFEKHPDLSVRQMLRLCHNEGNTMDGGEVSRARLKFQQQQLQEARRVAVTAAPVVPTKQPAAAPSKPFAAPLRTAIEELLTMKPPVVLAPPAPPAPAPTKPPAPPPPPPPVTTAPAPMAPSASPTSNVLDDPKYNSPEARKNNAAGCALRLAWVEDWLLQRPDADRATASAALVARFGMAIDTNLLRATIRTVRQAAGLPVGPTRKHAAEPPAVETKAPAKADGTLLITTGDGATPRTLRTSTREGLSLALLELSREHRLEDLRIWKPMRLQAAFTVNLEEE